MRTRRMVRAAMLGVVPVLIATALAPVSHAWPVAGPYNAIIDGRYDFHTWSWRFASCKNSDPITECATVSAYPMPIGRALDWYAQAHQVNGTYTVVVDVPDGLRCGNIYYGPVIPTHDVYTFDATTLAGKLESTFDVGCDNAPGGTLTYPFWLVRL